MTRVVFDRTVATLALVVLTPLLLLVALLVVASSRGPVIFKQVRLGRDGRPFEIYKFRTMVDGACRLGAHVSPDGDPRVTKVGRFLRAWYIDELPQFANVIKGDMALVGPRPETPEHVARYDAEERRVLSVRPGLAGPSTLGFMNEASLLAATDDPVTHYETVMLHERVRLDLGYLEDRCFSYDVRLLGQQLLAIVRR